MKILALSVLFFLNSTAVFTVAHARDCSHALKDLQQLTISLNKTFQTKDVTDSIADMRRLISECKIDTRPLGFNDATIDMWQMITRREEFVRSKTQIDLYASYGRVDDLKETFKKYAHMAGWSDAAITRYLKDLDKKSDTAYRREKAACKPVDMRADFGPVRNQDKLGWCYAFVDADLLSYRLKKRISAVDIALTHNKGFFTDLLRRAGLTEEKFTAGDFFSLNEAVEKGLCLEKDLPSEDQGNIRYKDLIAMIDKAGRAQFQSTRPDWGKVVGKSKIVFPNVSQSDLEEIGRSTQAIDFMQTLADRTCKARIKTDVTLETFQSRFGDGRFAQIIDEQLDHQNPLALAYDGNLLFRKRNYEIQGGHAGIIVGRRFNESIGQCEYLIRNSWGPGCVVYDKSFTCEEGNIWIPKADIIKRAMHGAYLAK